MPKLKDERNSESMKREAHALTSLPWSSKSQSDQDDLHG